nr:Patatin domain containing protein [Haemonchus contortus]
MSAKLHDIWAAPQATITEARLLLTLGANPECLYKDDYGQKTLMDRVDSGTVCDKCVVKFHDFLEFAGTIYEEMCEQTPINIVRGRKCTSGLLPMCMDGGGMRGLVSVVCLLFASKRLLGDETLVNYFDWLVGTSTGSMLALSTANGWTLTECFFLYWNMKRQIFLEGSTMSRLLGDQVTTQTRNIEKVLADCFPTQSFQKCDRRLTVPALDISMAPAKLHIFRNYSFTRPFGAPLDEEQDIMFKDAARASSAAPTYFEPFSYQGKKFVDGSFVANYPLNILFKEVDSFSRHNNKVKLAGVVSIGTGEPAQSERKYKSGTTIRSRAKNMAHLSTLILEQVVGQDLTTVEMAEERCHAHNIPFVRISPKGINVRIDQIDDGKLMDMIWTTQLWLVNNLREVDKLGELLYKLLSDPDEGKRRSNTIL